MRHVRWPVLVLLLTAMACGGGGGGGAAGAPTAIEVTSLAGGGGGSLAEAIGSIAPGGTISFAPALSGTIDLSGAGLTIDRSLSIVGPATGSILLHGGGLVRVLDIVPGVTVGMSDLEITGGGGFSGAGIRNGGTLTLERVTVSSCTSGGTQRGGGIQTGGTLTATDCTITNCQAYNGGGLINDGGTVSLYRCTLHGNMTTGNSGGGAANSDGNLLAVNCTFHDNHATGTNRVGGGLAVFAPFDGSKTVILSCTFAANTATGEGGGIFIEADSGPPVAPSLVRIENSIVAGNASGLGGPDVDLVRPDVTLTSANNNVIGVDVASGIVNGVDGNQVGTSGVPLDPMLGALADNGGLTLTRLPGAGSVARDAVPTVECVDETGAVLVEDQRGFARPVGGLCDAGAVESP